MLKRRIIKIMNLKSVIKPIIGIFIVCGCFSSSYAQGLSFKETMSFIEKNLPSDIKIKLVKEREIFVDFYKGGNNYRTDRVYLPTLDANLTHYSKEEEALILKCSDHLSKEYRRFKHGCFERTFHQKEKILPYSRMNLKLGSDIKKINQLKNAFNHLIRLAQDEGEYMGVDDFN